MLGVNRIVNTPWLADVIVDHPVTGTPLQLRVRTTVNAHIDESALISAQFQLFEGGPLACSEGDSVSVETFGSAFARVDSSVGEAGRGVFVCDWTVLETEGGRLAASETRHG